MAHHPQIAYAAQQTANQFAQRFSTNNNIHNDATKSSTPPELQNNNTNNNSNIINHNFNHQIPSSQIPMYYPNIIYTGTGQKVPPHQTFVQVSPSKKMIEECSEMIKIIII